MTKVLSALACILLVTYFITSADLGWKGLVDNYLEQELLVAISNYQYCSQASFSILEKKQKTKKENSPKFFAIGLLLINKKATFVAFLWFL